MFLQPLHLFVRRDDLGGDVDGFDVQLCADFFVRVLQLDHLLHSLLLERLQLEDVVAQLLVQLQDGQVGQLVGAALFVDENAKLFAQRGVLTLSNLDFLQKKKKKKIVRMVSIREKFRNVRKRIEKAYENSDSCFEGVNFTWLPITNYRFN